MSLSLFQSLEAREQPDRPCIERAVQTIFAVRDRVQDPLIGPVPHLFGRDPFGTIVFRPEPPM